MARMCLLSALVISACMILVKGELIGDTAKKRYNTNPGTGNGKAYVATKHPLKEGQLQKFEVYIHKATTRTVSARLFIWSRVGTSNEFVLDYSIPAELPKEEGLFPVIVPDPKPWVKEGSFMGWAYQSPGDVISFDYNTQFNTEFSFTLQAGDPFPWPILEETYTFDATPLRFEHAIAVDITVGTKPTTTITTTTTAQTTTTTTAAAPVASDTDTRKGYGIQCYVCNSHDRYEGKVCDDPFDENDIAAQRLLTNCSENHNTCMKMEQEVQGEKRIVRQCTEDAVIGMVERAGTKEVKLFYYGCDSQKCNGATSIYSHSILLFSIFAIFLSAIIKS